MRLIADEGVERQIVQRLRSDGHDVFYVAEETPRAKDDWLLEEARKQKTLFLTTDKDFGELVFRLRQAMHGVVLIRLAGLSPEAKARLTAAAFRDHGEEFEEAFSVISPGRVRIRRHS